MSNHEQRFIDRINKDFSDEVAEFAMSGYTSIPWGLYRFVLGYYLVSELLPHSVEVEDAWRWLNKDFKSRFMDQGYFV
jgi:hypothetical protein